MMLHFDNPDHTDIQFLVIAAIILWTILLVSFLVLLRRMKVNRDRIRRRDVALNRRESYIAMENGRDEAYLESLAPTQFSQGRVDEIMEQRLRGLNE